MHVWVIDEIICNFSELLYTLKRFCEFSVYCEKTLNIIYSVNVISLQLRMVSDALPFKLFRNIEDVKHSLLFLNNVIYVATCIAIQVTSHLAYNGVHAQCI